MESWSCFYQRYLLMFYGKICWSRQHRKRPEKDFNLKFVIYWIGCGKIFQRKQILRAIANQCQNILRRSHAWKTSPGKFTISTKFQVQSSWSQSFFLLMTFFTTQSFFIHPRDVSSNKSKVDSFGKTLFKISFSMFCRKENCEDLSTSQLFSTKITSNLRENSFESNNFRLKIPFTSKTPFSVEINKLSEMWYLIQDRQFACIMGSVISLFLEASIKRRREFSQTLNDAKTGLNLFIC